MIQIAQYNKSLKEYSTDLTQMVQTRTLELSQANDELNKKNQMIQDSLLYAVNMQHSLLPDETALKQSFSDHFVIWQPRDIVSGDIYFCYPTPSGCLLAVIDCTGHGVAGAFMTMIAGAGFESIMNIKYFGDPAGMLEALNQFVTHTLRQELQDAKSDAGMDMGLCCIDRQGGKMTYAGSKFSLLIVDNGEIQEIKGDRHSIGYKQSNIEYKYSNHSITISNSASYYLHSDGIVDQATKNKRVPFGKKRFSKILLENYQKPFFDQKETILEIFDDYRGNQEIRDDVTVFGFAFRE